MTESAVVVGVLCSTAVLLWPSRPEPGGRLGAAALVSGRDQGIGRLGPASSRLRRWRRPAQAPSPLPADLVMELVACALRAGLPLADALAAGSAGARSEYLDSVVGRLRLGVPAQSAWARPPPEYDGLARALVLAELSGAPSASVVTRAARDLRAGRRERAELAAARLGIQLVLPLGLAVLPGFILLAVAPVVIGLASGLTSAR